MQRLQKENQALKESQGRAGVLGLRTDTGNNHGSLNWEEEEEDDEEEEEYEEE